MLQDEFFIKPCPFCGNPTEFTIETIGEGSYRGYHGIVNKDKDIKQIAAPKGIHSSGAFINCNICYAKGPYIRFEKGDDLELIAIKQWNERNKNKKCKEFGRYF